MKKLSARLLKTYNLFITGLLALLGFASSCNVIRTEYGSPYAKFIVKGKVVANETNQPIDNIQVIMQKDTSYTDSQGNYQVEDPDGFPMDQYYMLEFKDIDYADNGAFQDLDSVVEFINPEFSHGNGHWYSGETSKVIDVKLNTKE